MKYYVVTIYNGDGDTKHILGEYDDLKTALENGERFSKKANRGDIISCIYGNIDDKNNFIGKHVIYDVWL